MSKIIQKTESEKDGKLSICDIMKNDTSEIIKEMQSKTPSLFQNYSNLYAEYLHMFDDCFGTCYVTEKEFFDKLNIDQEVLKQVKEISELIKKNCIINIDVTTKFFDEYVKMRISTIKSFDNYSHIMMDSYAKMFSQFNKNL